MRKKSPKFVMDREYALDADSARNRQRTNCKRQRSF